MFQDYFEGPFIKQTNEVCNLHHLFTYLLYNKYIRYLVNVYVF